VSHNVARGFAERVTDLSFVRENFVIRATEAVRSLEEVRDFVFAASREPELLFVRQNFVIGAAETVGRLLHGSNVEFSELKRVKEII
jgi:hypothetical protein